MNDETMKKADQASSFFTANMNCAQSVFAALTSDSQEQGITFATAACFGGGMRCGEVCGAVTGSLMALGLRYGAREIGDTAAKETANQKAVEFMAEFTKRNGSVLCRDLLGFDLSVPEDLARIQEAGLFHSVCPRLVSEAVQIADTMIS